LFLTPGIFTTGGIILKKNNNNNNKATLPVRNGGLEIQTAEMLALLPSWHELRYLTPSSRSFFLTIKALEDPSVTATEEQWQATSVSAKPAKEQQQQQRLCCCHPKKAIVIVS